MRAVIFYLLSLIAFSSVGQVTLTGKVYSKETGETLPGVNIREKNTSNGANSDLEGRFSITIQKLPTTLEIFFIGMVSKEITIQTNENLVIQLKSDCYKDSFDHQLVGLYLNSDILNNPYGGEFQLSFPAFWKSTTLKTKIGYQTDFNRNENLTGQIAVDHIIFSCDYELDLKAYYHNLKIGEELKFKSKSMETHFIIDKYYSWFKYVKFIAGIGILEYELNDNNKFITNTAPVLGIGTILGEWWRLGVDGKIAFYKHYNFYNLIIKRDFKCINTYIEFSNFESYTKISLGIGTDIGYRIRSREE